MPKLIVVPTPIGNLDDITLRAIKVLQEADFVLAEDTRTSGNLLRHLQIEKKLVPHHQFNEHKELSRIVELLKAGSSAALVTDAGTPGISDPGYLLIRECVRNDIEVECLPGPTAFVPALVVSGIPCDKFCFEGFLPHKKGRQTRINILKEEARTIILYESPHRLAKTLEQLSKEFGEGRSASVSRELSKVFEETKRGTLKELHEYFSGKTVKGEIVIIVAGKQEE